MDVIRNFARTIFFLIISFSTLCSSAVALEGQIALFPFEINSENNLSFLEKGIFDMLSARIKAEKMTLVNTGKDDALNKEAILRIAKGKKAEYAISGSIMVFGNTVNINAFLYDTRSGDSIVAFNKIDNNKDNLLNHINAFADEVLSKIKVPEVVPPVKIINMPVKSAETTLKILGTPIYKSEHIESVVQSFTTGDVNGDGVTEIVIIDSHNILIATYQNGKFEIQQTIEGKHYLNNYFVDVIDTNNNGIGEIFITSSHRTSKDVQSQVYEWNGDDYVQTIEKSKWLFATRALNKDSETILIGQKQHFAEGFFSKGAFELVFDQSEKKFISGKRIELPEFTNIYDSNYGDVTNKGVNTLISFTSGGYLAFYDDKQTEVWKSSSRFGGSPKYLEPRKNETQKRLYLSPRIVADDIDNDAITEVVTIQNNNSSPRVFVNLKNFTSSNITCLFWNKLNLETRWNTQTVSGYIPDFSISDIDNDGKNDLIYCVVEKIGKFWKTQQTYFVIQSITSKNSR